MAVETEKNKQETSEEQTLEGGAYEIIRKRLLDQSKKLLDKIKKLNANRKEVFGALENKVIATDRIITENNCVPRDMISFGNKILFGYNVFIGLKKETKIADVFSLYDSKETSFTAIENNLLNDPAFLKDFNALYNFYRKASFANFFKKDSIFLMIFHVGKSADEIKAFKWHINKDNSLTYIDNRSPHEYTFPPQRDFEWTKTTKDQHSYGRHPHISIEDKVFVECVGGDLTIKVEDNTDVGTGIYQEEVTHRDQTLDDADVSYATMGHIILLRIFPYQEDHYRYFIFNEKHQKVVRADNIEQCAIRLPDNDGLIFPKGYYLENGEYKAFSLDIINMKFLQLIRSPNGEDFLHIFYNEELGEYILLQYNLIAKKVENPVSCHGFTIFEDGKMVIFKADNEPKKSHAIQIWQTPFVLDHLLITTNDDSYLSKLGNKTLVRGIADLREVYSLLQTEEVYLGLYHEVVRNVTNALDTHFWLDHKEAFAPKKILLEIRTTANSAINEFEKVVQIKQNTERSLKNAEYETQELISDIKRSRFQNVEEYVSALTKLQVQRGHIISLKDLRYVEAIRIESIETIVIENYDTISEKCVDFLLDENALAPFFVKLEKLEETIPSLTKVTEIKKLGEELNEVNKGVDLLTDLANNLKIDDSTKTSQIIDSISNVYSIINRVKAIHKKHLKSLFSHEAQAEFSAQFKLINQSVTNFLDQAETAEKCEELLTKVMVQIEELEGKFSDFEEYIERLGEKRNEVYSAFNNRKVQLLEQLNRKTQSLWNAADRIFKGISNRTKTLKSIRVTV